MRLALCPREAGSAESQRPKNTPRTKGAVPTGYFGKAVPLVPVEILGLARLAAQAFPHSWPPPESTAQTHALRQPPGTPERCPSRPTPRLPDPAASQLRLLTSRPDSLA